MCFRTWLELRQLLETPKCYERQCRYFIGVSQPDGTELSERVICAAFPDGIPGEISYGDNLHLRPYPGDHGIQYEKGQFVIDKQAPAPLQFTRPDRIDLKGHPDFAEKWVQQRIIEDPTILGLGDVELVVSEKIQPRAGRLDLLLHDDQLNRRYEVELMLGATDPSHIVRCIEYWDIERRRFPAYDHVAVLVAEDITSRFLNVMALLAGSIPLIAIQAVALQVADRICLHFVRVLDQTALRSDDTFKGPGRTPSSPTTDRSYWQGKVPSEVLSRCDSVVDLMQTLTGHPHRLLFRKVLIDVIRDEGAETPVWLWPQKTLLRVGAYVTEPGSWVKRFDDVGQLASLKRGNKAVAVSFTPQEFDSHRELLTEFLQASLNSEGPPLE